MSAPVSIPYSQLVMQVLVERECERRRILERCAIPEAGWEVGPLFWLTQHTRTEDTHWLAKGTDFKARFPRKPYFLEVMKLLMSEPALFIWKSREMMMSWLVTGYIAWMCTTKPVFAVVQTGKEDKVAELIEYARILHRNQESWMQARNPLVVDNELELKWAKGGRCLGVPKGADQIRVHHPHIYFQDESAFLPEAQQAFDTVRPVAKQIICVSSDEIGWFHDECKIESA